MQLLIHSFDIIAYGREKSIGNFLKCEKSGHSQAKMAAQRPFLISSNVKDGAPRSGVLGTCIKPTLVGVLSKWYRSVYKVSLQTNAPAELEIVPGSCASQMD